MKRMTTFTRPNGDRVGIAAFDIHRVYTSGDPNLCSVTYHTQVEGEWCEETMDVVGTFDDIMDRIEGTS